MSESITKALIIIGLLMFLGRGLPFTPTFEIAGIPIGLAIFGLGLASWGAYNLMSISRNLASLIEESPLGALILLLLIVGGFFAIKSGVLSVDLPL